MADLRPRLELWGRPAARVCAAGGPRWRLNDSVAAALNATRSVELTHRPLRQPDGVVPDEVADADILIAAGAVDEAIASQLRNVRFVIRPWVGYDDIDVDALTGRGIVFANVPDAFIEEVANHTLALILAVNRRLLEADAFVKAGRWSKGERNRSDIIPIRRASTLKLGLVGFGNIARLVVERARPFGFELLAADPYVSVEAVKALGVRLLPLDDLLAQSDIVSVHVFLNPETRGFLDARRLALMKPGAYLINTSRGPVIDEPALIQALQAGRLAGAGLDVFQVEPIAADNPLLRMRNVVLTPHVASYSEEGDVAHHQRTAEIILQVVRGDLPERKVVVNKELYDQLAAKLQSAAV